jgi:8-oxo-dGTP pyrophosphatase MutT (NUDIX family)
MVEPGEAPFQGAVRELLEETGISHVEFSWGKVYRETPPYSRNKVARYYLGKVLSLAVRLTHEHHEYRWVSYEEASSLVAPRTRTILDWAWETIQQPA